ncbi:hypothetical protein LFT45_18090 [Arthrobacter sp. FW305-BF8]|uniref:hypothetical protein n=1 Tax=Arthrobacter sp. FW305-BF8 TaxID=2879617 RepID=UPI001F2B5F67|nr:hypothetical protein [Arthrobacter sp. FW305-BF8]UKA53605.1 hypothetical protein LFT45_18090 [Arthrobacter sp. FW305-BF8]
MNPAGRASDPSAASSARPLRRLIAGLPVAAFLIVAATVLLVVLALLRNFRTLTAEAGHGAAVAG